MLLFYLYLGFEAKAMAEFLLLGVDL